MQFLAEIYFKIEIENEKKSQFDCQYRFIEAENENEALFFARESAIKDESEFTNKNGQSVKWIFSGVTDLKRVDLSVNGTSLFSKTVEADKKQQFEKYIELKNRDLSLQIGKKELIFSL